MNHDGVTTRVILNTLPPSYNYNIADGSKMGYPTVKVIFTYPHHVTEQS